MNDQQNWWGRLALMGMLAENAPTQSLGRTALVKLAYLLQATRGVPLGYDFRLYTYGPFDSEVLSDLGQAQALEVVDVTTVINPVGYGYEIRPGSNLGTAKQRAADWLARYEGDIHWIAQAFGNRSASELELIGTIVYVDREFADQNKPISTDEAVRRVREIKPHFVEAYVRAKIEELGAKQLLTGVPSLLA
jgi:hypothetical protein